MILKPRLFPFLPSFPLFLSTFSSRLPPLPLLLESSLPALENSDSTRHAGRHAGKTELVHVNETLTLMMQRHLEDRLLLRINARI